MGAARSWSDEALEAVKRRPLEIFDAFAPGWRRGTPHIHCVDPNHSDANPSFRVDPAKGVAFCTCSDGAIDPIDLIRRVHGCGFLEALKIAARIIGFTEPTNGPRPKRLRHDADSLLNAPAELRDDSLMSAYFGSRLDVSPDQAPTPSTRVVGLRALEYFDAPAGRSGAPELIGAFPCAIFETIAPDGRRSAHRIYLAPGGAGKAELGTRADGTRRDPKKAAKRPPKSPSSAGCAVLFGDQERAPHTIAAEGIETAAAIAFAYREEIAAGEILVAAAISAPGLAAFAPWPACRRLTIAADRDEAPKRNGRPGSRTGEKAARRLLKRLKGRIKADITLPGAPGESIDFLDVLRRTA